MLLGVWSINLHNFMDGIDGLLAQQGVFVGAGIAWLAWGAGSPTLAGMAACLAAACLGFWYYNRAPARIFMGDVGSGSIGFMVFALTAMLWRVRHELLWPALVPSSAFAMDAGLTLALRMLRGRRWYAAHREHLYQWLVRCGFTHAGSSGLYLTWRSVRGTAAGDHRRAASAGSLGSVPVDLSTGRAGMVASPSHAVSAQIPCPCVR